jgi:hypothetical protein
MRNYGMSILDISFKVQESSQAACRLLCAVPRVPPKSVGIIVLVSLFKAAKFSAVLPDVAKFASSQKFTSMFQCNRVYVVQ